MDLKLALKITYIRRVHEGRKFVKNINCKCCVRAFAEKKNMLKHIEFIHVTKNSSNYKGS